MDWEVLNGITGIISAIAAVCGIGYFGTHSAKPKSSEEPILSTYKLVSFVVACSGWALCCLSFLWIAEPFGRYPSDSEYQQFFGFILAFPAVIIFLFGVDLLQGEESDSELSEEHNKSSKKDAVDGASS